MVIAMMMVMVMMMTMMMTSDFLQPGILSPFSFIREHQTPRFPAPGRIIMMLVLIIIIITLITITVIIIIIITMTTSFDSSMVFNLLDSNIAIEPVNQTAVGKMMFILGILITFCIWKN